MKLDTGGAVSAVPLSVGPDGNGDGRMFRSASGNVFQTEVHCTFRFNDGNGMSRTLNARLAGVQQTVSSAGSFACRGGSTSSMI